MTVNSLDQTTNQTAERTQAAYTTDSVISKDGTKIGYRQLGHGPGVMMLHGAMESAQSHMGLAQALADQFTVYLPDRRGRGLSGAYRKDYSTQDAVDDLDALLTKTGARNLFGVSSGAMVCLQAALKLTGIDRLALYEPALIVNHSVSTDFLARYDREIAEGKIAAALVTGMKGAHMGPPILNAMPRFLLEYFSKQGMAAEDKTAQPGDVTMRVLAPTLHYDFQLIVDLAETLDSYRALQTNVLLLGGSQSPAFLKIALDALEKTLPNAKRVEFPGLDHGGSSDLSQTNRNGHPEIVAPELRRFFA